MTNGLTQKELRQFKLIELLAQGVKLNKCAVLLGVNERTLRRDRLDIGELPVVDELIRKQMSGIEEIENMNLRLKYRGELIRVLRPQRLNVEADIGGTFIFKQIVPDGVEKKG